MRKGFTLIEMLVTLALLSILCLFIMPANNAINRFIESKRFEGTANELLEDMRHAKVRALTSGEVQITFSENGYMLTDTFNKHTYKRVTFREGTEVDYVNSTLPDTKILKFMSYGSVSPYACSVILKNDNGNSSCISIKVATFTIDFKGKQ